MWDILACSYCGHELQRTQSGAECHQCGTRYEFTDSGSLDLRLKKRKKYSLEFDIDTRSLPDDGFPFEPLRLNPNPEVDFSNVRTPYHLTKEMMSYFPRARSPQGSLVLDIGCGDAIHKTTCEHAGFEWIGLDRNPKRDPPILGDAHALPFKSNTFEFILSVAALQYIRFPFVMMREVCRVLKPHGRFIGTVAFLEPFHDTFYHYTHWGVFSMLQYGGFTVQKVAPSERWTVLAAQADMGLFPKMPGFMSRSIVFPVEILHKLWWRAGGLVTSKASKITRIRNMTGAFTFVATKGDD